MAGWAISAGCSSAKCSLDDPAGGGVDPRIGDLRAPVVELGVEIVEVAEAARQEEVLADVAIGPLDLALGLGPVRPAGARHGAVVVEQRDQRGVVLHHAVGVLADHRRLHAVVEQLGRRAVHGGEGVDVTAQDGLQILGGAEPAPDPAAVAEDHREQPEDAHDAGLVGELHPELGEVDLPLFAGGGLEAALEGLGPRRPGLAQKVGDDAVAARIAELLHLAQQPLARQVRPGRDAGAQVVLVWRDQPRLRRARAVGRRLHADLEVPAHGLAVEAELARDGRDAEPLPLQVVDQDDLSQCDHLPAPSV